MFLLLLLLSKQLSHVRQWRLFNKHVLTMLLQNIMYIDTMFIALWFISWLFSSFPWPDLQTENFSVDRLFSSESRFHTNYNYRCLQNMFLLCGQMSRWRVIWADRWTLVVLVVLLGFFSSFSPNFFLFRSSLKLLQTLTSETSFTSQSHRLFITSYKIRVLCTSKCL